MYDIFHCRYYETGKQEFHWLELQCTPTKKVQEAECTERQFLCVDRSYQEGRLKEEWIYERKLARKECIGMRLNIWMISRQYEGKLSVTVEM